MLVKVTQNQTGQTISNESVSEYPSTSDAKKLNLDIVKPFAVGMWVSLC